MEHSGNQKIQFISPIAIDMGAKSTGVLIGHYPIGEEPLNLEGKTFVIDTNSFKISSKDRLANRHRMRAQKRRKLAKRLFFLILENVYGFKEDKENPELWDFIRGLLNRRGFTYITEEEDEGSENNEKKVPWEVASYFFPKEFDPNYEKKVEGNAIEYLKLIASEKESHESNQIWSKIKSINLREDKKLKGEINSFLNEYKDLYDKKEIENYLKELRDLSNNLSKHHEYGIKYRKDYFKDIEKDIKNNKKLLEYLKKVNLKPQEFYRIIAHISNLQLRILRKYFNDPKMKDKDYWDDNRLKKLFLRYVRSWHPKKEIEKKNQRDILNYFKLNDTSILEFFKNSHPELTIPPYEDQNNRRIPHCQSLLLDANKLDQKFGNIWRKITDKLTKDGSGNIIQKYDWESIQEIHNKLKSSLQGFNHKKGKILNTKIIPFDTHSILLQRVLEENQTVSFYLPRLFVKLHDFNKSPKEILNTNGKKIYELYKEAYKNLTQVAKLTNEELKTFYELAKNFYQDIDEARLGIWDEKDSLLSKCNSKTKHKNKTQRMQVEQILRIKFKDNNQYEKFLKEVWNQPIKGKVTIKSICRKIEEIRKEFGNTFKNEYRRVLKQNKSLIKNNQSNQNKGNIKAKNQDNKVLNLHENVKIISNCIHTWIEQNIESYQESNTKNKKNVLPYSNPFSLAQLFNILETERHGFNKLCEACIMENTWRARQEKNREDKTVDIGVRLSSDTGRPFDGQIDRILSRLGWEIAKAKIKQLQPYLKKQTAIEIPIILEYNQFNFTDQLYDIKGVKSKNKRRKILNENSKRSKERLISKEKRIISDSNSICAYTGKKIHIGEIDHILPRSYSLENYGTILNSEINLLYVSREGNQIKGNQDYKIENIHKKFLKHHFKTENINELKIKITDTLEKVFQENQKQKIDYLQVESLDSKSRLLLKMGLFYDDLRPKILSKIQTHSRTLANGTQVWLFKKTRDILHNLLKSNYPNIEFYIYPHYIGTNEDEFSLSNLRTLLSEANPTYTKRDESNQEGQKETSHIIDATMVFAKAILDGKINLKTPLITDEATPEWLESLLPEDLEIIKIEKKPLYRKDNPFSTSLFKQGMFAERFLSFIIQSKQIRNKITASYSLGFIPKKNLHKELNDKEEANYIFNQLKPFLKYRSEFLKEKDTLESLSNLKTPMGYILLKIDRQKAKEYLQKCNHDDKVGLLLESLRYITQNKNIIETIEKIASNKKKNKTTKDKDKDKDNFKLNLNFKVPVNEKSKSLSFSLDFPIKDQWEFLIKKISKIQDKNERIEITKQTLRPEKCIKNKNFHRSFPRKLSFPTIIAPSGGFRIERTAPSGEKVYQVQASEGHFQGFAKESNKVNFQKPIINPIYIQKSISPYKLKDKENINHSIDEVVIFDEWKELPLIDEWKKEGIQKFYMCPDTESRCYVKWLIDPKRILKKITKANLYELKSILKYKNLEGSLKHIIESIGIKPRDNLYITKINPNLLAIEYIVSGFPTLLKELYNNKNSKPVAIP